jgi:hypothetical protein
MLNMSASILQLFMKGLPRLIMRHKVKLYIYMYRIKSETGSLFKMSEQSSEWSIVTGTLEGRWWVGVGIEGVRGELGMTRRWAVEGSERWFNRRTRLHSSVYIVYFSELNFDFKSYTLSSMTIPNKTSH